MYIYMHYIYIRTRLWELECARAELCSERGAEHPSLYIYVYICIYIHTYIYMFVNTYMYIYIHLYI